MNWPRLGPIISANVISLSFRLDILILKLRYDRRQQD